MVQTGNEQNIITILNQRSIRVRRPYSEFLGHGIYVYVLGQNEIKVKMILTKFDSQFPLSSNPD